MDIFEMAKMISAPELYFKQVALEREIALQNHHAGYNADACDAMLASMNNDLALVIGKEAK